MSADAFSICMNGSHAGIYHHIDRLVRLTELDIIDSRLMRQGIFYPHVIIIQFHLKGIGGKLLLVISIGMNRLQVVTLIGSQVESRTLTMIGHYDRKAIDTFRSIIRTLRINTKHTVGQLDGREGGNQQMTDVANVRIHIIHTFFLHIRRRNRSTSAHEGSQS